MTFMAVTPSPDVGAVAVTRLRGVHSCSSQVRRRRRALADAPLARGMTMKTFLTHVTLVSFLATNGGALAGQSVAPAAPPARATRAHDASVDGGWPRTYMTPTRARVVLYQPQVASWPDEKHMTLYAAVSYLASGKQTPALGALRLESDTSVALAERLVSFAEFMITESSFPNVPKDDVKALVGELMTTIPRNQRVIALDRVLAGVDTSQITPRNIAGVKADPPPVFYSQT